MRLLHERKRIFYFIGGFSSWQYLSEKGLYVYKSLEGENLQSFFLTDFLKVGTHEGTSPCNSNKSRGQVPSCGPDIFATQSGPQNASRELFVGKLSPRDQSLRVNSSGD